MRGTGRTSRGLQGPQFYNPVITEGLRWPSGDKPRSCDSSGLPFISLTLNQGCLLKPGMKESVWLINKGREGGSKNTGEKRDEKEEKLRQKTHEDGEMMRGERKDDGEVKAAGNS